MANETLEDVQGMVTWSLRNARSDVLQSGSQAIDVPALTSVWLDKMDFSDTAFLENHLEYRFAVDGTAVSEGSVLFTNPKHYGFADPQLRCERSGDEITVFAKAYAKSVEIGCGDADCILSDNYFDMEKGQKTVRILQGDPQTLNLRSVYDIR